MPSPIDALTVTLGLDSSGFQQGQNQTEKSLKKLRDDSSKTAKQMQADGAKGAEMFSRIKTEALSLIGVLIGASSLKSFIGDTTKSLAQVGRDARSIGESAPGIEAFANAIQRMGGSASSATSALQAFASTQARAKLFGDPAFMQEMGLIGGNLNTKPLDAVKLFMAYIEKHRNEPGGIQNIEAIAGKIFPGMDKSTLQAMEQIGTVANLNKQLGQSYALGVPSPEMIYRATQFQKALAAIGQAAKYDGDIMLNSMYPALTKVTNALVGDITQNPAALAGWSALAGYLTVIAALRWRSLLTMIGGVTSFLELPILAAFLAWKGFHIGGLNVGEDAELKRLRGGGNPGQPLNADVEAEVRRQAALNHLDPDHMVRLAQKEGGGYSNVSPSGAFGPMQLMPKTAAEMGVSSSSSWQSNVAAGVRYYAMLRNALGGNYVEADAAYNAGPNNPGVIHFVKTGDPSQLPAETKDYINTINGVGKARGIFGTKSQFSSPLRPVASSNSSSTNSNSVTIGTITVHSQATDANGIARDLNSAIVTQANRGAQ